DSPLTVPPYWLVLAGIGAKSTVFAIFLVATFMFWFPMWTWLSIVQPVRALFAWSFDGIMVPQIAYLSPKFRSPLVALAVTGLLSIGALAWAVYSSTFFTVLALLVLLFLTPMFLVALSAFLLPYLKPHLWERSPLSTKIAGI